MSGIDLVVANLSVSSIVQFISSAMICNYLFLIGLFCAKCLIAGWSGFLSFVNVECLLDID